MAKAKKSKSRSKKLSVRKRSVKDMDAGKGMDAKGGLAKGRDVFLKAN